LGNELVLFFSRNISPRKSDKFIGQSLYRDCQRAITAALYTLVEKEKVLNKMATSIIHSLPLTDAVTVEVDEESPNEIQYQVELTIVMPCLNEAETLETCIRKAIG